MVATRLAAADVFVFPSRTDTFGLVMLEVMSCGVPVSGPVDVVQDGVTGTLDRDLRSAVLRALKLGGVPARRYVLEHSWAASSRQFLANLAVEGTYPVTAN